MKKPALLILAAGSSSRMGQPKQLLPFKNATLLGTILKNCFALDVIEIYCVLGAHAAEIKSMYKINQIHFIQNKDYKKGLSTSIVCGVKNILSREPDVPAIFILLGDQPFLDHTLLRTFIAAHHENPLKAIVTSYHNSLGVPVIFPKQFFNDLLSLKGDKGAKKLIQVISNKYIIDIAADNLIDIDTKKDYMEALKHIQND